MRISDVMTTDLPTVTAADDLRATAQRMAACGAKALPVCDGARLVGIVTDWDITRAVAEHGEGCRVADFMSTDLLAAGPETMLVEAAEIMAERRLHHLLVCEGEEFRGMLHLDVEWGQLGAETQAPMATFAAPV